MKANVILITIDSLRPDHMGAYGYSRNTTPFLDGLSRESVVFENAYANSPWTLPSLATILTSLYPTQHGMNDTFRTLLNKSLDTLPAIMAENGYHTYAVNHAVPDFKQHGLFDKIQKYYTLTYYPEVGNSSIALNKGVKALIKEDSPPFLLWIHYFEPHYHYNPSPPYDTLFITGNRDLMYFKRKTAAYCYEKGYLDEEMPYFEALYDGE